MTCPLCVFDGDLTMYYADPPWLAYQLDGLIDADLAAPLRRGRRSRCCWPPAPACMPSVWQRACVRPDRSRCPTCRWAHPTQVWIWFPRPSSAPVAGRARTLRPPRPRRRPRGRPPNPARGVRRGAARGVPRPHRRRARRPRRRAPDADTLARGWRAAVSYATALHTDTTDHPERGDPWHALESFDSLHEHLHGTGRGVRRHPAHRDGPRRHHRHPRGRGHPGPLAAARGERGEHRGRTSRERATPTTSTRGPGRVERRRVRAARGARRRPRGPRASGVGALAGGGLRHRGTAASAADAAWPVAGVRGSGTVPHRGPAGELGRAPPRDRGRHRRGRAAALDPCRPAQRRRRGPLNNKPWTHSWTLEFWWPRTEWLGPVRLSWPARGVDVLLPVDPAALEDLAASCPDPPEVTVEAHHRLRQHRRRTGSGSRGPSTRRWHRSADPPLPAESSATGPTTTPSPTPTTASASGPRPVPRPGRAGPGSRRARAGVSSMVAPLLVVADGSELRCPGQGELGVAHHTIWSGIDRPSAHFARDRLGDGLAHPLGLREPRP